MSAPDLHPEELFDEALGDGTSQSPDARRRLVEHLRQCDACRCELRLRLDFADEDFPSRGVLEQLLMGARPPVESRPQAEPRRTRPSRRGLVLWAAAAALLVGGGALARWPALIRILPSWLSLVRKPPQKLEPPLPKRERAKRNAPELAEPEATAEPLSLLARAETSPAAPTKAEPKPELEPVPSDADIQAPTEPGPDLDSLRPAFDALSAAEGDAYRGLMARFSPSGSLGGTEASQLDMDAAELERLAERQETGYGGASPSPGLATALREAACGHGDAQACSLLAMQFLHGNGVPKHDVHAERLFERACTSGSALSCRNVALLAALGRGVRLDDRAAQGWFRKACRLGDDFSCGAKSAALEAGANRAFDALPPDVAARVRPALEACAPSTAWRCIRWGERWEAGLGVPSDSSVAAAFYRQACTLHDGFGCAKLGSLYAVQRPERRDEALPLLKKGCWLGKVARACFDAALLSGLDSTDGKDFLSRGCALGDEAACRHEKKP